MKYFVISLRILIGITFIVSGIFKLYPIEPFEYNFVYLGFANFTSAPLIARALIALEIFLGALLISGVYYRKFTLPATLSLLVFFTGYLCFQIYTDGNNGNCGCFGTILQMTPLQAILKNLVLIIFIIPLFSKKYIAYHFNKIWLFIILGLSSISTPFILNMPDWYWLDDYNPQFETGIINFKRLPNKFSNDKVLNFEKGNHVLVFLGLSCPHCQQISLKVSAITKRHPQWPIYAILFGEPKALTEFKSKTRLDYPYAYYNNLDFMKITGGTIPAIFLIKEGKINGRRDKITLNESELEGFFNNNASN